MAFQQTFKRSPSHDLIKSEEGSEGGRESQYERKFPDDPESEDEHDHLEYQERDSLDSVTTTSTSICGSLYHDDDYEEYEDYVEGKYYESGPVRKR